jgi:hypothetical protein
VADYVGNSASAYIANRLNPTAETLAWHLYPHYQDTTWLRRPPQVFALPELPPRIQGIIGDKIYRKKQPTGDNLAAAVHEIMQMLSEWFANVSDHIKLDLNDLDSNISCESISTYLHYYHCINMTARPLILYAVQKQIAANSQGDGNRSGDKGWDDELPSQIVDIINKAIAAARTSALLIHTVAKHDMIGKYKLEGDDSSR